MAPAWRRLNNAGGDSGRARGFGLWHTRPRGDGVTCCQVLAIEANQRLSYTWNASGEEAARGLKTVVTWTLTPVKGGTRVHMEQSGFRPEEDARNYQGASYGWQRFIGGLEHVVGKLD